MATMHRYAQILGFQFHPLRPAQGVAAGADLYDLNPDDYADPGTRRTTYRKALQPVRNGDLANLALDLLDLDAVPGSEHNSALDLDVSLPD